MSERIYVVIRSTGEYSDRREDTVVAFTNEGAARRFVLEADAQAREAEKRFTTESVKWDYAKLGKKRRIVMTLDPDGADSCDTPTYFYNEVPLFTSLAPAVRNSEFAPKGEV